MYINKNVLKIPGIKWTKKCDLSSVNEMIDYFKIKENRKIIKDFKNINKINVTQLSRVIRVDKRAISKLWE